MAVATFHDPILLAPRFNGRYLKPGFRYSTSTTLICPGATATPSYFVIEGRLYQAFSNLTCNLAVSGVGGLRTGLSVAANTLYYLYAVADSKTVFLIADTVAPTTGLTGYRTTDWTYLGAFLTNSSSQLLDFVSVDGRHMMGYSLGAGDVVVNSSVVSAKTLLIPTTAVFVYCRSLWTAINAVGDDLFVSALNTSGDVYHNATSSTAMAANDVSWWWAPIITAQTLYMKVTTTTSDSVTVRPYGWIENVSEFR